VHLTSLVVAGAAAAVDAPAAPAAAPSAVELVAGAAPSAGVGEVAWLPVELPDAPLLVLPDSLGDSAEACMAARSCGWHLACDGVKTATSTGWAPELGFFSAPWCRIGTERSH
jgi:hypothetical protein